MPSIFVCENIKYFCQFGQIFLPARIARLSALVADLRRMRKINCCNYLQVLKWFKILRVESNGFCRKHHGLPWRVSACCCKNFPNENPIRHFKSCVHIVRSSFRSEVRKWNAKKESSCQLRLVRSEAVRKTRGGRGWNVPKCATENNVTRRNERMTFIAPKNLYQSVALLSF